MAEAPARVVDPPAVGFARFSTAIARIRPAVVGLGLLLMGAAFALAGWAILRDYQLRVARMWNGVTGTPHGIAAHGWNEATAELAIRGILVLTGVVGLTLAIPRRDESPLFRWTAWVALLLAAVLITASVLGLVGLSFHGAWAAFDPRCPFDGPCGRAPKPMTPAEWRVHHVGGLGVAATSVGAILAACVGARWIFWVLASLLRKVRAKP